MILLDTNIISEMMKPVPNVIVMSWIGRQDILQMFISTITIAEISYGLNVLPQGIRNGLEEAFNKAIAEAFTGRLLVFDESAAHHYGKIMSYRKELGKPLGVPDGQIAAIARAHGAAMATRNLRDFMDCGLQLINPFKENT
jgi:predicted nucleic acid-binding protein